ncbi:hypothetical protein LTS15_004311 [Exophiala xenobiotica]|nr:hypothetical protein LTS15_004311 [Exophiala xenobiotica]
MVGHLVIKKEDRKISRDQETADGAEPTSRWKRIDLTGALLLVLGLSAQLAAMSMGGNNYPWSDIRVIMALLLSIFLLVAFVLVEIRTKAIAVMPMSMLKGTLAVSNLISNVCVGMAAYSVVLRDSASQAGMRLVIPSLATPAGGLLSGIIMSRWGRLSELVRVGCLLMMIGNGLVASLRYQDSSWKYLIYLVPANFGQGMSYPAILFTFLAAFDHNVSTSMVYLFRSMGTVWGVAASSTLIQNVLTQELPRALEGITHKEKVSILQRGLNTVLN